MNYFLAALFLVGCSGAAFGGELPIQLPNSDFKRLNQAGVVNLNFPSLALLVNGSAVKRLDLDMQQDWKLQTSALIEEARACDPQLRELGRAAGKLPADLSQQILGIAPKAPPCLILLNFMPEICAFCVEVRDGILPKAATAGVSLRVLELEFPTAPMLPSKASR